MTLYGELEAMPISISLRYVGLVVAGAFDRASRAECMSLSQRTPMTNLLLTMLYKAGVPHVDKLGDSTGRLDLPTTGLSKVARI